MSKASRQRRGTPKSLDASKAERGALLHSTSKVEYVRSSVVSDPAIVFSESALTVHKLSGAADTEHPQEQAWCGSRLMLSWVTPLVRLGHRKRLEEDDVWPLPAQSQSSTVSARFAAEYWRTLSLSAAFWHLFGGRVVLTGLAFFIAMVCTLVGPLVLRHVLTDLEDLEHFDPVSPLLAIGVLFVSRVIQAFVNAYATLSSQLVAIEFVSALKTVLFAKTLRLSSASRATKSTAEIASMYTTDSHSVVAAFNVIHQLWLIPLQIALASLLLYTVPGDAALACISVVLVLLGVNLVMCMMIYRLQIVYRKSKDACMQRITEVFKAIRNIKLNASEPALRHQVYLLRRRELRDLRRRRMLVMWSVVLLRSMPMLLTLVAFGLYTIVLGQTLTPNIVFSSLSILQVLQMSLQQITEVFPTLIQAQVGIQNISEFLKLAELDHHAVDTHPVAHDGAVVTIEDGEFGWDNSTTVLRGVNLRIQRGGFYVIQGPVGSGKSSLCSALLGEMVCHRGAVSVRATVGYCSQQPWLQNASIRDNILFGLAYDDAKYEQIIEACALKADLESFPSGDSTVIGERAVNLSGGQKARVALARACYSEADVLVLDSPLAAIDATVQSEVMHKCLLGLLRGKTIVLVTHNPRIIAAKEVTHVITVGDDGSVTVRERDEHLDDPTSSASTPASLHVDVMTHSAPKRPQISPRSRTIDPLSTSRVGSHVFSAYFRAAGGMGVVVAFVASQFMWQAFQIASDLWLSSWARDADLRPDDAASSSHQRHRLIIYGALGLASIAMVLVRAVMVTIYGLRAGRNLFEWMTNSLMHAPTRFFDKNSIGRILMRYASDISTIDLNLPQKFGRLAQCWMTVACGFIVATVVIQWRGFLLIPLALLYGWVTTLYLQPARDLERLVKTSEAPVLAYISETVDGGAVIRAFGPLQVERFAEGNNENLDAFGKVWYAQLSVTQWFAVRIQLIGAAFLVVVTTSLILLRDKLGPEIIGLAFLYSLMVAGNLEELVHIVSEIEAAMVSPERVQQFIDIELEPPHRITSVDVPLRDHWPGAGAIEFRSVNFRYAEHERCVLNDLSVSIEGGEKLGIVGRTGAGKSSVFMALFRMNELESGAILIDGVDISTIGLATLRENMSIISQDPILFRGTLRSNLDPVGCFSDDELYRALRVVDPKGRVLDSKLKLERPVEANGNNLSIGEHQMLCLAKALLRETRIVVLDEATAAVDLETDAVLHRAIRVAFAKSTVLTITHRLDTIWDCDRVLVLDHGRSVDCASPKALVDRQSGIFYELMKQGGYLDSQRTPASAQQVA